MKRTLLKSKIHRATVTEANVDYQGSVTIDPLLMEAADLLHFERVEIYNVSGDPDSPGKVSRAIDGNPATSWQTDSYFQQFPSFKRGIGLVVSFPQPVTLTEMKATAALKDMALIRQSRLSVCPVTDAEWATVCKMAGIDA